MNITTYGKRHILATLVGNKSAGPLYLGLSTTTPNDSGSAVVEPISEYGYSRVQLSSDPDAGGTGIHLLTLDASLAKVTNPDLIMFQEARGDWGVCTYFVLYDAATGGNLIGYGAIGDGGIHPTNQTVALIRSGQLSITLNTVDDE